MEEIIMHYFVYRNKIKVYRCNQCFYANMKKATRNIENVTCVNCIKCIKKDKKI